jgi:uncharacterized membrane protein
MTERDPLVDPCVPPAGVEANAYHTSMAHMYRGEVQRMTVWRQRLDTTSNWAILLTFGMTTFALGSRDVPHYILLLGLAIISICLVIEARRYRHLHHSEWRVALVEHNYFARLLSPGDSTPEPAWRRMLAKDLEHPRFTLSWFMATRLRLRKNYLMLVYFITAAWLTKVFMHPHSPATLREFYDRLALGDLFSSWFVAVTAGLFILCCTGLAALTPTEDSLREWSRSVRRASNQAEILKTDPSEPE